MEIANKDFDIIKSEARQIWNKNLSKINVKGWSDDKLAVFYTALYRTYERMIDINEHGQYYSSYDHKVHDSKEPFYVDNWIWDSYIAHHPLNMILDPKKDQAMIRSYIEMHKHNFCA